MSINNRLTKEELDIKVQEGLDAIPVVEKDNNDDEGDNQEDHEEIPETEESPVQEDEEGYEETKELPDVEERYKESSKEATSLYFKNKKITDTIAEASSMADPTEDELRDYAKEMGEDLDNLDNFAKNLLKNSLKNERRFSKINSVVEQSKEIERWLDTVDTFAGSEATLNKYPSLANNAEAFRKYASREQRRGMDLEDLVASFLFNLKTERPVRGDNKSLLLDRGNGRNQPTAPTKMDEGDAIALRNKDQKAYKKAIKDGKIDIKY